MGRKNLGKMDGSITLSVRLDKHVREVIQEAAEESGITLNRGIANLLDVYTHTTKDKIVDAMAIIEELKSRGQRLWNEISALKKQVEKQAAVKGELVNLLEMAKAHNQQGAKLVADQSLKQAMREHVGKQ